MSLRSRALGCLLALVAATTARADEPLDSAACQVDARATRTRQLPSGGDRSSASLFSCGVAGKHQFGLRTTRANGDSPRGLSLTGRTTLRSAAQGSTGFGLTYALGFGRSAGQGLRHESAPAIAVPAIGDGALNGANLGWRHSRTATQSSTNWSLGVERGDSLIWSADLFGDDRSRPWVSAGAGWSLLEKLSFNVVFAHQFERKRVKQMSVGLKLQI